MNDHNVPDPNNLVFFDITWDSIDLDTDDKVNCYDLPAPDYDAYVCPRCGRIILFDGNSNRCISYKPEND